MKHIKLFENFKYSNFTKEYGGRYGRDLVNVIDYFGPEYSFTPDIDKLHLGEEGIKEMVRFLGKPLEKIYVTDTEIAGYEFLDKIEDKIIFEIPHSMNVENEFGYGEEFEFYKNTKFGDLVTWPGATVVIFYTNPIIDWDTVRETEGESFINPDNN